MRRGKCMETPSSQESHGSQEPIKDEVRPQITVTRATKKELKILMIRMDLKNVGDVVDVLLRYYQENHEPWPGGAIPGANVGATSRPGTGGPVHE
jgi:hypothetical protein